METSYQDSSNTVTIRSITRICRLRLRECTSLETEQAGRTARAQSPQYKGNNSSEKATSVERDLDTVIVSDSPARFTNPQWAENRLSDLNLWDAAVGASASGSNSLDFRLQNDSSALNVVISSLATLAAWLAKCRDLLHVSKVSPESLLQEASTDKTLAQVEEDLRKDKEPAITLEETKLSIEQLLKLLVTLGVAIRKAGTASRHRNADRTLDKHKDDYSELVEHLTFILRLSDIPRITKTSEHGITREELVYVPVNSEANYRERDLVRPEQWILINANIKRQHRIIFARNRAKRLRSLDEARLSATIRVPQDYSSEPHELSQPLIRNILYPASISKQEVSERPAPPPSQLSATATNQASEFGPDVSLEEAVAEASATIPPTSIARKMDYPDPPQWSQGTTVISCPYCTLLLTREATPKDQWKKHVSGDLRPYTCYFSGCPHDETLFDTFKAWKAHVFSEHIVFKAWRCPLCEIPRDFAEESVFNEHIRTLHQDVIAEEYLDNLSNVCRVSEMPAMDRCPVCSMYESGWKARKAEDVNFDTGVDSFLDHIGTCMHDFSLRSLPLPEVSDPAEMPSTAPTGVSSPSSLPASLTISTSGRHREGLTKANLLAAFEQSGPEKVQVWLESIKDTSFESSENSLSAYSNQLPDPLLRAVRKANEEFKDDIPTTGDQNRERVERRTRWAGFDPSNYAVGWICAITTEYVAARAFLDEEHEGPEYVSLSGNNNYTLGKIGKHNIVIAALPDGEYGISSAAGVARDMLHSFPNIRIGLMVGIGGGVPSQKHDIRLGDIVVSSPRNGKGGVFQYDFGKTIQDRGLQQTRFLNQPPTVLRTALSGLKARYESDGHRIEEAINDILEKKQRLRQKYKRPGPSSDRLYQSGFSHSSDDEASCVVICGDNPLNLILRRKRAEDEDNPAIHYGLIASANQLMKDALLRDKFAKENDILCFEMEAAGLTTQFPCLVIRGICDYSDTHKNKEWQGYAAMAAAAYAKDLICQIPPRKVEAESRISDPLSDVLDTVSRTRENIETLRSKLDRNENLEILNWLTPIDYSPQQSDFIKRRQEGTGTWLLHTDEFNIWLNQENKTLYCSGIPGAGKTILTSVVIDHLCSKYRTDFSVGIAYLYCSFQQQHQQKPEDLLLSLLKQLVQKRASIPESVKTLYECHNRERTRPSLNEILEALKSVAAQYPRVLIIVDALDECSISDERQKFLSAIFDLQANTGANIFATSRINNNIAKLFEVALSLRIHAEDEDIKSYLDGRMSLLQSDILDDALQGMIRREVIRAVDGMFLLAQLHMNTLMYQPTKGDIKQALEHLTKGIDGRDETYKQAMERIEDQGSHIRELAIRILAWIVHAKRPLFTTELQHALGVRLLTEKLDGDYLPSVQALRSVCAGLVTIDEQSGIVRLVHYTTQEYFERTWTSWFPFAQRDITNVCVTYLLFDVFETGFCQSDGEFEARLKTNILYDYAARNWGHHAHQAFIKEDLILNLLESRAKVSAASQAMMASRGYSGYSQRVPRKMTGVHVAAYFGLVGTIMGLLKKEYNPDLQDSYGRTPLSWAAKNGHEAVVKLLLATERVNLDSKATIYKGTPLSWAAENGHQAVVKLLLATERVDLDSKDISWERTPLSWAAGNGYDAVVKLLLATERVDLDSKDISWERTPLSWAAGNGYDAVVKLLLATERVGLDYKDSRGRTPLSWAAGNGHQAVVKLLQSRHLTSSPPTTC
ncbi:MAG: hypothetical protein M1840_006425 [Geoglossum simile]|nr:MAG: hypothetical protein M1840_006425 [Geoglossum simile]